MENGEDHEVVFRDENQVREEEEPEREEPAPPTPITHCDMDIIIRGWEEKFMKMTECLREVQISSERASSDMCMASREARAQGQEHERRLEDFMRSFDNFKIQTTPHVNALRASTPRICPEFGYDASPVGRDEVSHPEINTLPHTRSARTEDPDSMETHMGSARSTLPHFGSARTEDDRETHNTLPHFESAHTEDDRRRATRCRTPVVRAQGNNYCSGTRATGIRTTISGKRAPESKTTFGTRAPYNFVLTIDLHTRITKGTVERHNRVPTTPATTHRFHARHQDLKFRHLMDRTLPNSALGLYNLRPSRAIRAGQQGNGLSAWSPR